MVFIRAIHLVLNFVKVGKIDEITYAGEVWWGTPRLALGAGTGHGQKHICLNHQVDGDKEEDECDDDKYHRSIAQGSCNWWPSKLAPYNVSVDDPRW